MHVVMQVLMLPALPLPSTTMAAASTQRQASKHKLTHLLLQLLLLLMLLRRPCQQRPQGFRPEPWRWGVALAHHKRLDAAVAAAAGLGAEHLREEHAQLGVQLVDVRACTCDTERRKGGGQGQGYRAT
jgi:hypothetical protein